MNERLNAIVGARITEFRRKMAEVNKTLRSLPKKTTATVNVVTKGAEKRINLFQDRISRLANSIRAIGTVLGNMVGGSMLIASPSMVPILATTAGLIGALGPMIGVLGGSTFALATAFGFAGTAALAFGATAIPTITKLFEENEKLTKSQRAAKNEFDKFKKTWNGITKDLEEPVLKAFGQAMKAANRMLKMARPLFDSAAKAVNNLLSALNKSLNSPPVKAFFDYMNKNAGPMLETVGKSLGNFIQGLLSMMTAFGPLAEKTAQGFLDMSKGFATWAAGLSKSEKFQSFVNYVNENMPKLRAIFRDVTAGLVYMFAAFGPLASDMMTGLQNMMARFKEWARTLGENQQFQKFIGYIRDNAPTVIALIGNITTTLVNLGIAMAPLGSKILEMVNNFFSWTSSMLKAHPVIGQIFGGILIGIGILQILAPLILSVTSLFSGFGTMLAGVFTRIVPLFNTFKLAMITGLKMLGTQLYLFGTRVLTTATTLITGFLRMIAQSVVWAGKMALNIASVIARFALLSAKAALHAAKVALSFTVTMVKAAAKAAAQFAVQIAKMIGKYALLAAKSMVHAARVAASWFVAMGPVGWVIATVIALVALIIANWDKVKAATIKIWGAIKSFFSSVWSGIKSIFNSVINAIKSFVSNAWNNVKSTTSNAFNSVKSTISNVWNNIKSSTSNTLSNIVSSVKTKFTDTVNAVKDKMNSVKDKIKTGWNSAVDFIKGINLKESGKKIIGSLADGITAAKEKVVSKVKSVAQSIRDFWPFSPPKTGPLTDLHKVDFGWALSKGIEGSKSSVTNSMAKLAGVARNAFAPNIAMADIGGNINAGANMGAIKHAFSAELNDTQLQERPVYVRIEGDAEWIRAYVNEENAIESQLRRF